MVLVVIIKFKGTKYSKTVRNSMLTTKGNSPQFMEAV